MFVYTSAFKAQAGIDVIEGKIMAQQHLMEEAPVFMQQRWFSWKYSGGVMASLLMLREVVA